MYTLHFLYLFTHQWTLRLFTCLGYCEYAAVNVYLFKLVFFLFFLFLFRSIARSGIAGPYGIFIICFLRNLHAVFQVDHFFY